MQKVLNFPRFRFPVCSPQLFYSKKSCSNLKDLLVSMPKEPKHVVEAQKHRLRIKQRNAKYVPGRVSLQFVGSGAKGAPRALYLFSDQSRYLFNCGEGTQRLAHEHKSKLAKLEHIFITQAVWQNIGGLPGTALTIQDVGVPQITLHGPPGLNEIFVATKRFVVIRDMKITMADCSQGSAFEDNVLSVKYVPLSRSAFEKDVQANTQQADISTSTRSEKNRNQRRSQSRSPSVEDVVQDDVDYYAHERKKSRNRRRSRSRSQSLDLESGKRTAPDSVTANSQDVLQKIKEEGISMCYICQLQPRPGALNLDKCVKKGVPAGPLLGVLKNGEDVVLPDGTLVKSSDVCELDDPGPVFLVVDCPSVEYISSLVNNEEFKKTQKFAAEQNDVACLVVHFTPKEVMERPEYKSWMNDFIASTDHISVNESNTCGGSIAVHRIQQKLNILSSDFFPLLRDRGSSYISDITNDCDHVNKKAKCPSDLENLKLEPTESSFVENNRSDGISRNINTLCTYHLRPKKGYDSSTEIKIDPQQYFEETMSLPEFPNALAELQQKLTSLKTNRQRRAYPKILFLGTGSCIPNKTRNTSGILFQMSEHQSLLMDCGEGTYGQIIRFFGPETSDEVLSNIDAVYISHLHADHHIGLIGLLQGRRRALKNLRVDKGPVHLFAPIQILTWLNFYDKCFQDIKAEFYLVPNSDLILNEVKYPPKNRALILESLGLYNLSTCLVKHCPNAFGLAIVHKDGYKVTYSGDTMPCENLVELGLNSDVLIHEATMEDELEKEAVVKMHSTTSQAIQVGNEMNAKHVILTHFSQRYAKLPRFNDNFADHVSIAFDNMQISLDDLPLVPLLYPALKIMFAEHYEELEHKAVKRQLKAEREASLDRKTTKTN